MFKIIAKFLFTSFFLLFASSYSFALATPVTFKTQSEFEQMVASRMRTIDQDFSELRELRPRLDKDEQEYFDTSITPLTLERESVLSKIKDVKGANASQLEELNRNLRKQLVDLDSNIYTFKQRYADKSYGMAGILGL